MNQKQFLQFNNNRNYEYFTVFKLFLTFLAQQVEWLQPKHVDIQLLKSVAAERSSSNKWKWQLVSRELGKYYIQRTTQLFFFFFFLEKNEMSLRSNLFISTDTRSFDVRNFMNVAQFSRYLWLSTAILSSSMYIYELCMCMSLLMSEKENNSNNNNTESVLAPIRQTTTNAKQLNESFMHRNQHSMFNTELNWIQIYIDTQTNIVWTMQAGRETRGGEKYEFWIIK